MYFTRALNAWSIKGLSLFRNHRMNTFECLNFLLKLKIEINISKIIRLIKY